MRIKSLFVLVGGLLLAGCTSSVHLGYTPVVIEQKGNSTELSVKTLEDQRENKERIGVVRDGFGFPTFPIETPDSVPEWITDAIKVELARAGYIIAQGASSSPYVIEGKILESYADAWFTYKGFLRLEITLKKSDETLFQKVYDISESNGLNVRMQASSCMRALEKSLQECSRQLIEDVNIALRQKN